MGKQIWKARLVHVYKDIMDSWDESPFREVQEAQIDEKGHVIKNVCVFGTRYSKNGYTYQDKAIESLHKFTNGTKFFINHPSKSEAKERDGVRDIRDWAGVFSSPRKEGEKVYADLSVRPAFWDLVKDVAIMKPAGMGNSINSRVKVFKDGEGKEHVVDIENLKSIDLVASAATTQNLFESAHEKAALETKELVEAVETILNEEDPDSQGNMVYGLLQDMAEGVLLDKMKEREVARRVNDLNWKASDIIDSIIRDPKKEMKDKKAEITSILEDLDGEINGLLSGKQSPLTKTEKKKEDEEMDWSKLTLEDIQKEKPELIKAIQDSLQKTEKFMAMEKENLSLKKTNEDMAKELTTLKAQVENLTKELTDAKKKVDEYETKTKAAKKEAFIAAKIEELKVPKDAVTEFFRSDLMAKDEKAIEEALKDRKELYLKGKSKNLTEFDWKGQGDEGSPEVTKEKKEAAQEKILSAVKR